MDDPGKCSTLKIVFVSLFFGLILGLLTFWLSYQNLGPDFYRGANRFHWNNTGRIIIWVEVAVDAYKENEGAYPLSLKDLSTGTDHINHSVVPVDLEGYPLDRWNRRLSYSSDGTSYTLLSLGADGRPGGEGYAHDISVNTPSIYELYPSQLYPYPGDMKYTLKEFLFKYNGMGVLFLAALNALLGFAVAYLSLRSYQRNSRRKIIYTIMQILIIFFVSIFVAQILAQLHIPSGH